MAVADAYAIAFEFVKEPKDHGLANDLNTFQQNPRYSDLLPSLHTDDTQRSIATANWLINSKLGGGNGDPYRYIFYIMEEFHNHPRAGWSKNFQSLLKSTEGSTPKELISRITNKADSNGSIMGVLPCGYLSDPVEVRMLATIQAITTHSVMTAPYAQMLAMAAHFFIHGHGSLSDLIDYLDFECQEGEPVAGLRDYILIGPVPMDARTSAYAALTLLQDSKSLREILWRAVDLRGDTDSVAALAVGLGACCEEIENDLPEVLINGVENGDPVFRKRMMDLTEQLERF